MKPLNVFCVNLVRWSGWLLLPVVASFLFTGYALTGQYGLSRFCQETTALAWHRMLHGPLAILLLAHSVPAVYLALRRWGWIKPRAATKP
ncbi:MAG: hypothetical protein JXQ71_15705 [Verrucomicrobia bacterium]|nr:hypothetical protein [Verrucomicrobiota bacterium]